MTLHRQHTNWPIYRILYANEHFYNHGKTFTVTPLYHMPDATESMLAFMESYFIELLQPELNRT